MSRQFISIGRFSSFHFISLQALPLSNTLLLVGMPSQKRCVRRNLRLLPSLHIES